MMRRSLLTSFFLLIATQSLAAPPVVNPAASATASTLAPCPLPRNQLPENNDPAALEMTGLLKSVSSKRAFEIPARPVLPHEPDELQISRTTTRSRPSPAPGPPATG